MTERRLARRYDLTLPVSIRTAVEKAVVRQEGRTRDISTKGLYFLVERDLEAGSELDLTLTCWFARREKWFAWRIAPRRASSAWAWPP